MAGPRGSHLGIELDPLRPNENPEDVRFELTKMKKVVETHHRKIIVSQCLITSIFGIISIAVLSAANFSVCNCGQQVIFISKLVLILESTLPHKLHVLYQSCPSIITTTETVEPTTQGYNDEPSCLDDGYSILNKNQTSGSKAIQLKYKVSYVYFMNKYECNQLKLF